MELLIDRKKINIRDKNRIKEENNTILFRCTTCGKYLPISEFELRWNNSKTEKNNVRSQCKHCRTEESRLYHYYRRRKYTEQVAKEKMLHYDKLKHDLEYHNRIVLYRYAKNHSKRCNIKFNITPNDIIIPKECPILKHEFILNDKQYTYSIDRIDNSKGYIPGNIAVISRLANIMKNCANFEQLILFSENIKDYIKKQSKLHV